MELALNCEGTHYMLGLPLGDSQAAPEIFLKPQLGIPQDNPRVFSEISIGAGEVEGLPQQSRVRTFQALNDAEKARRVLQSRYGKPIAIYRVRVERLQD